MRGLHPPRRTLLAFDGGDLGARGRRRTRRHLAGCARCRARLTRLRALRNAAADATDVSAPDAWARIEARRAAGEIVLLPAPEGGSGEGGRGAETAGTGRRGPLVAAVVALAVLSGSVAAAVAVPPVRGWVSERLAAIGGRSADEAAAPVAGLSLEVGETGVVVDLPGADPSLVVSAGFDDVDLLDVVGVGPAALGEYRSAEGRVRVSAVAGGELRVVIPRAAAGPVTLTRGADTLLGAGPEGLRLPDGSLVRSVRASVAELLRREEGRR